MLKRKSAKSITRKTTRIDRKESIATRRFVRKDCPHTVDYIKLLAAAFSTLHTLTLILLPTVMNLPYAYGEYYNEYQ